MSNKKSHIEIGVPQGAGPGDAEALIAGFNEGLTALSGQLARRIVGQDDVVRGVLAGLFAGGHVLLEGVPGLGKTLLVQTLAEVLDLKFSRIQFTPDLMPADVTGTNVLVEDERGGRRLEFKPGPVFTNLLLADEINRATPKTQSSLLQAMQEHSVSIADQTYILEEPFFVLATQNPLEMEGTYPLPEAQLDRFMFKIQVGFPSREELGRIVSRTTAGETTDVTSVMSGSRLIELKSVVRRIPVPAAVSDYAVRLVLATHPEGTHAAESARRYVRFGASPRGAQALILGAKVHALAGGRANVGFQDVDAMIQPALCHRLILGFDAMSEGISAASILDQIVADVPREFSGSSA